MNELTAAFRRAVASLWPSAQDKVVLNVDDVAKLIELTGPRYHHDSKSHLFVMNACGLVPSVRMDNGFVRSYYADPRRTIPTRGEGRPQFQNEIEEEPPTIRSSAAIMVLDRDLSRWSRGVHIVVRGAIRNEDEPAVIMAMGAKYDKKSGAMTVQRLYVPVFEGQRITGKQKINVTQDNVKAALKYMDLCFSQMKEGPAHAVYPWHNYRDSFARSPAPSPRP